MKKIILFTLSLLSLFLFACGGRSTTPLQAVQNFDAPKYMGKWYEIARFNHSFEEGMNHVYTQYALSKQGEITVKNVGFKKDIMYEANATGRFKGASDMGEFEVCFFYPFYGTYKIILLDPNYQYAIVTSSTYDYLWFLSRTPTLEKSILEKLLKVAKSYEFQTENLIFVEQEKTALKTSLKQDN